MEMTFGEVEALLARIHDIRSDRRTVFVARLKNLLRLGVLPSVNRGKGNRSSYTAPEIATLAIAAQFTEFGLSPERVVGMFAVFQSETYYRALSLVPVIDTFDDPDWSDASHLLCFDPHALDPLTESPTGPLIFGGQGVAGRRLRVAQIDLTLLLHEIAETLGPARGGEFLAGLSQWAATDPKAVMVREQFGGTAIRDRAAQGKEPLP